MAEHAEDGGTWTAAHHAITKEFFSLFGRWTAVGSEDVGSSRDFAMETIHPGWQPHTVHLGGRTSGSGRSSGIRPSVRAAALCAGEQSLVSQNQASFGRYGDVY